MEKKMKSTMVRLSEDDLKALLTIRMQTGIKSDNQAIIFALHWTSKYLEPKEEQGLKPDTPNRLG
jgi:hypothetical protein